MKKCSLFKWVSVLYVQCDFFFLLLSVEMLLCCVTLLLTSIFRDPMMLYWCCQSSHPIKQKQVVRISNRSINLLSSPELKTSIKFSFIQVSQFFVNNLFEHLKGNSGIFKRRPYFWHEIRLSTHREQFGESRRPSEAI